MKLFNFISLLILAVLITGCAGGRNYDYRAISIDPLLEGKNANLAVGVHDQRVYVKKGDKYPQYVGTQRSPAYVPWNINTKSGLPMADDFCQNIAKSLRNDGFTVDIVYLSEKDNKRQALINLQKTGDDRLLLFTINEWYFDVWYKTRMEYSLSLEVFNNKLVELASAKVAKKMWGENDNAIPDLEFKSAVEKLLSDDSIVNVLEKNNKNYTFKSSSPNMKNQQYN